MRTLIGLLLLFTGCGLVHADRYVYDADFNFLVGKKLMDTLCEKTLTHDFQTAFMERKIGPEVWFTDEDVENCMNEGWHNYMDEAVKFAAKQKPGIKNAQGIELASVPAEHWAAMYAALQICKFNQKYVRSDPDYPDEKCAISLHATASLVIETGRR